MCLYDIVRTILFILTLPGDLVNTGCKIGRRRLLSLSIHYYQRLWMFLSTVRWSEKPAGYNSVQTQSVAYLRYTCTCDFVSVIRQDIKGHVQTFLC